MKKHIFTLFALCSISTVFAQKPVVQHAGYMGIGGIGLLSSGYEARFRNFDKKPDFSVGMGLFAQSVGFRPSASVLFGKGSHAFELGLNSSFLFDDYVPNLGKVAYAHEIRPFIGYRLQPKNHRFFLQAQGSPFVFTTYKDLEYYKFDYYGPSYLVKESSSKTISMFQVGTYPFSFFELRLGINLNRLQDTLTQNTAYEAPKAEKLPLQHAFFGGLNLGYEFPLAFGYDLRWRRPQKVDFAGNVSLTLPDNLFNKLDYYRSAVPRFKALAIFGDANAAPEAGLSLSYYSYASNIYQPNFLVLGVPLGFRYQPQKGFFWEVNATPLKAFAVSKSPYSYYGDDKKIINTMLLITNFGYTF